MPWKETCAMDQRMQLIGDWLTKEFSITELSESFGVSRPTVYKWIGRYRDRGSAALEEMARRPLNHPNATHPEIIKKIVEMKLLHQKMGPKKIVATLQQQYAHVRWPAISTAGEILKRQGLVRRRKRKRRVTPYADPLLGCSKPNSVWSADYKGQFNTGDGKPCYPLTITDNSSRYLLQCRGLGKISQEETLSWFEWTFREYGLPDAIRTDNGVPFASASLAGLSRLSVWFIKLGIKPERILPGHPEQNGRHERMHRTLKEATVDPPKHNLAEQQEAFEEFKHEYNCERPHEALCQKTPASVYQPSPRTYPIRLPPVEYDDDVVVKRVRHSGELYWKGRFIHLSKVLAKEPVALKQVDDHLWRISFSFYPIGVFNELIGTVSPLKTTRGKV
jgi:transposase InsO family protein/transposase-like protein